MVFLDSRCTYANVNERNRHGPAPALCPIVPAAYQGLASVKASLQHSSLGLPLIELVYLRVSQINGCAFCLKMHASALRARGKQ